MIRIQNADCAVSLTHMRAFGDVRVVETRIERVE